MSVLDEVLKEEYDRLLRMRSAMNAEYDALPKGSISKKIIRGCDCYYLQYREGEKIISKYIKKAELAEVSEKIERRRSLKRSLRDIDVELKKIERTVK
jgi:hypothetical protein